jgi:hypothetical protein
MVRTLQVASKKHLRKLSVFESRNHQAAVFEVLSFQFLKEKSMASQSSISNQSSSDRVVAFFKNREDAFSALEDLKEAGFTSSEVGLMGGGTGLGKTDVARDESMWDKIKQFFSGDSRGKVDYRHSSAGMDWDKNRGDYYYRGLKLRGRFSHRDRPARAICQRDS